MDRSCIRLTVTYSGAMQGVSRVDIFHTRRTRHLSIVSESDASTSAVSAIEHALVPRYRQIRPAY